MPFLTPEDQLKRILEGEIAVKNGLASLFDKQSGHISLEEDLHIDYKRAIDLRLDSSIGEFARDVSTFTISSLATLHSLPNGGILEQDSNSFDSLPYILVFSGFTKPITEPSFLLIATNCLNIPI